MKVFRKGVVVFLMVVFLLSLMSGCKKAGSKESEKPDIHSAFVNYQNCQQKKSEFEGSFKVTMFYESGNTLTFGQKLKANRIQNNDRYYVDATLTSDSVSDNLISLINSIAKTAGTSIAINQDVKDYLGEKTMFAGRLGYSGGTYNFKGDYLAQANTPDFLVENKPYWYAIDEGSIKNLQTNLGFKGELNPKDYLMFSTMLDFSQESGWISNDSADSFYDEEKQAYVYAITTLGAKIKAFLLNALNDTSKDFDEEQYAKDLQLYAEIIPTVSNWIKTPDAQSQAQVDKEKRLKSFSHSIRIDIDINVDELFDIFELLLPEEKAKIKAVKFFLDETFASSSGQLGIWTVRIDLAAKENFYYDSQSINLDLVDADMFLDIKENNENRETITILAKA